jgi:hypothetical protein
MSTEISTNTQPRGLSLQSVADAMKFSETVANSDFAPKDFRGKPASCMLAIQCGAEIGLAPLQALQSIAVVNGRPAVYGDAALAVVKASHVCDYVIEACDGDGEQMVATCTAQRRGYPQPTVVKFSVADAKKAGLWGKSGPWSQYPRRMLQMRARGFALRDAFPDVLKGLVTAEEAQDYPQPIVAETPRQPVEVRPKFDDAKPAGGVIKMKTPQPMAPEFTPVQKARLAVSRAETLERCDALRRTTADRLADGTFTQAEHDEIAGLLVGRAEMLIGNEVPA